MALRYAAAVAARGRAVLNVVYVNNPLLIPAAAAALHDRHLARRSAQQLREFIEATFTAGARTPPRLKSYAALGDPVTEILERAARSRADLIVVGTHGLHGRRPAAHRLDDTERSAAVHGAGARDPT